MPSRRELIRMTDDELWSFVEEQKSLQLATIHPDGAPHLVTLWFAVVDGKFVIETFTKSQKIKNLERDDRLSALLEDGDVYDRLRGVSIRGRAELVRDPGRVAELSQAVLVRNTPGVPEEALTQVAHAQAPKKTAILIHPEKIMSWDHGKLGGIY